MQRAGIVLLLSSLLALSGVASRSAGAPAGNAGDPGIAIAEAGLSPQELAGAEIWYKATAGDARFTTYVFQQRLGVLIDWYRVLRADQAGERFRTWGLIHDPDCCVPGAPGCPAKSPEETYGFEYCRGDDALLPHVGKAGYRDPACDFRDPDDTGGMGDKQSPCDLQFGTSTGALGFRKLPNPRFDAARWRKFNGGRLGTWEGLGRRLSTDPKSPDSRISHLADPSIEPPFLIGMACGACHISFDPLHPPVDPAHPRWENLKGGVGNPYVRVSEIMASGTGENSFEWQLFSHERPGTVDTSAIPNDQVHNPGTMNALINLGRRPTFPGEKVVKWRPVASCPPGADPDVCWCEPGKPGKCKERKLEVEAVHHILKGGEDSIGLKEAIQRVYFNIGSCSETCWVNHLTDLRQIDREQRNFGQTEFQIGQCRRDCPGFRAVEDRLDELVAFFLSRKPTDLWQARGFPSPGALVAQLDRDFGPGAVERGRALFAQTCAGCHSSQPAPFESRDFLATDGAGNRLDWLGSDRAIPASKVGTDRCRALHSNHMRGHVFGQYASATYQERPGDPGLPDPSGGGRGYYRAISLINVWAFAPLLHNNAVGPEVCGSPADPLYRSPYVAKTAEGYRRLPAEQAPRCWPFDPSVEGRYKLFRASIEELLTPPAARRPKLTLLDDDIDVELGPRTLGGKEVKNLRLLIPRGEPVGLLVSFDHKRFLGDLILAQTDPAALKTRLGAPDAALLGRLGKEMLHHLEGGAYLLSRQDADRVLKLYSFCTAEVENVGHPFGTDLPPEDKKALIAFLSTL